MINETLWIHTYVHFVPHVHIIFSPVHAHHIIHRDIKPENILLDGHDNTKLTDFGVSQNENEVGSGGDGTPAFMSPESTEGMESFLMGAFPTCRTPCPPQAS